MNGQRLASLVFLAWFVGCASVPETTTYRTEFERLKTRDEKAAFTFHLMSRGVITPPASIDTVYAIFGSDMADTTTNNGICMVEIFLNHSSSGYEQLPQPWILRLDHVVDSRRIEACALHAPGIGK
jgi:hypothetical protein